MAGEVLLAMKLMVSQAAAKKDAKKPRVANVGPSVAESVAEGTWAFFSWCTVVSVGYYGRNLLCV